MKKQQFRPPSPARLTTGLLIVSMSIFVLWFLLTVTPVLAVEARYQYRRGLENIFGISSFRAIFIPDFDLDFRSMSKHKEYGITIPKLYLDEPVVFNVDPNDKAAYTKALQQGIAHASSTSLPDASGIGYYFAHSSSPELRRQYNAIFYTLGKLEEGDEVFIWFEGEKHRYVVQRKEITTPNNVEFLQTEYSEETIVLQTCWPVGTTQNRMLVFATRQEE
jgi:LPXTG-site transpeptidase (sortase) family protein